MKGFDGTALRGPFLESIENWVLDRNACDLTVNGVKSLPSIVPGV
jgi:hypothetical protein